MAMPPFAKKKMLDKMKMPSDDTSMADEAAAEGESPEEEASETEPDAEDKALTDGADLSAVSDDDLLAEVKKRGLADELNENESTEPASADTADSEKSYGG